MRNFILTLVVIALALNSVSAQGGIRYKVANDHYEKNELVAAIEIYEEIKLKRTRDTLVLRRLAHCYDELEMLDEAVLNYRKLYELKKFETKDYLDFALLLLKFQEHKEALEFFVEYQKLVPEHSTAKAYTKVNDLDKIFEDSANYNITAFRLNSEFSEFSPVIFDLYKGDTIFSSNQRNEYANTKISSRDENYFIHLRLSAGKKPDNNFKKFLRKESVSKFHDGPLAFTPDQNTIFLTRSNTSYKKKLGEEVSLNLYKSVREGGDWSNLEEIELNNNEYSIGHAAFSNDGKTMYFVSDMPNGLGGTDIWKADYLNGELLNVENLGPGVNTELNEMFPYITDDNNIIFSSEGRLGIGGLDLFIAFDNGNSFDGATNMGYPLNSNLDDFGLILNEKEKSGMFSSNRTEGKGGDDIYLFTYDHLPENDNKTPCLVINSDSIEIPEAIIEVYTKKDNKWVLQDDFISDLNGGWEFCYENTKEYMVKYIHEDYVLDSSFVLSIDDLDSVKIKVLNQNYITGTVEHAITRDKLVGVAVNVYEKQKDKWVSVGNLKTDENGQWRFDSHPLKSYKIDFEKEGFNSESVEVPPIGNVAYKDVSEDLNPFNLYPNGGEGTVIRINNIYFNFNKSNPKEESLPILDNIVTYLEKYPTIKIELSAHTDAVGKNSYNMKLSQKRAKSCYKYLLSKGIDKNRIIPKGYGETQILNGCINWDDCTTEENEVNRRVEVKVLSNK